MTIFPLTIGPQDMSIAVSGHWTITVVILPVGHCADASPMALHAAARIVWSVSAVVAAGKG
ncbi:MAG: hypothetical protein OXC91_14335 [Rhodobacteraceae bacterium]|nr:hypothetical protein [Paracoccaceae bacterium]